MIIIPRINRFKWERRNKVSVTPAVSLRESVELALYNITVPTTHRVTISTRSVWSYYLVIISKYIMLWPFQIQWI